MARREPATAEQPVHEHDDDYVWEDDDTDQTLNREDDDERQEATPTNMPVVGSTTPDPNKGRPRANSTDSDNYVWNDDYEPPEELTSNIQIPNQMIAEALTERGYMVEDSYLGSGEKGNESNTANKEPAEHTQTRKSTKDKATSPWHNRTTDAATQWSILDHDANVDSATDPWTDFETAKRPRNHPILTDSGDHLRAYSYWWYKTLPEEVKPIYMPAGYVSPPHNTGREPVDAEYLQLIEEVHSQRASQLGSGKAPSAEPTRR